MSSYSGTLGGPLARKVGGLGDNDLSRVNWGMRGSGPVPFHTSPRKEDSRDSLFFALPPRLKLLLKFFFFPLYIFDEFFLLFQEGEKSERAS